MGTALITAPACCLCLGWCLCLERRNKRQQIGTSDAAKKEGAGEGERITACSKSWDAPCKSIFPLSRSRDLAESSGRSRCSEVPLCPGDEGLIGCRLKVAIRDNPCAAVEVLRASLPYLRDPLYFPLEKRKKKKEKKGKNVKHEKKIVGSAE